MPAQLARANAIPYAEHIRKTRQFADTSIEAKPSKLNIGLT